MMYHFWTDLEKKKFAEAIKMYGRDWETIHNKVMPHRSANSLYSYSMQLVRKNLPKDREIVK
jgi:hypothetical protein